MWPPLLWTAVHSHRPAGGVLTGSEALRAAATASGGEAPREVRVLELAVTAAEDAALVSGGGGELRGGLFRFIDELNNPNHHRAAGKGGAPPLGLVVLRVNEVRVRGRREGWGVGDTASVENGPD